MSPSLRISAMNHEVDFLVMVSSSDFASESQCYLSKGTHDLDNWLSSHTWPRNKISLFPPNWLFLHDIQTSANGAWVSKSFYYVQFISTKISWVGAYHEEDMKSPEIMLASLNLLPKTSLSFSVFSLHAREILVKCHPHPNLPLYSLCHSLQ